MCIHSASLLCLFQDFSKVRKLRDIPSVARMLLVLLKSGLNNNQSAVLRLLQ